MRRSLYVGDNILIVESLMNIGDSYANQNEFTKAVYFYYKCMDLRQKLLECDDQVLDLLFGLNELGCAIRTQ